MTQIDLLSVSDRSVDPSEVETLIRCLRGKGWMKRDQVAKALGWSIRKTRAAAEHSEGAVIPGNKGIALVWEVLVPEAERAARRLENQGKRNIRRGYEIRQQMHRCKRDAA